MKIEKLDRFSTAGVIALSKCLITKTVEGWLITRIVIYGDAEPTKAKAASNSVSFQEIRDPNHSIDPEDFFFASEK